MSGLPSYGLAPTTVLKTLIRPLPKKGSVPGFPKSSALFWIEVII